MTFLQFTLLFAVVAPFGIAAWVAYRHRRPHRTDSSVVADEDIQAGAIHACCKSEILWLEAEVKAVADAMAEEARDLCVSIQLAVIPGSTVFMDWNALWLTLRSTIRSAIQATPGGNVLVTGKPVGREMHIVVMDDGAAAEQRSREGLVREAAALIALQGGSMVVEARRGRGTTVTIRLPVPNEARADRHAFMAEPTLAREVV